MLNPYLHGTHDRGAEHLHGDHPGYVLITEEIGLNLNVKGADYSGLTERGFTPMVRLNRGYGNVDGTIPLPHEYEAFAATCAAFVARSRGCNLWIIGNEPNHENERPQGIVIQPEDYGRCFQLCREAIKRVNPNALVLTAAVAPYHAAPLDWAKYLTRLYRYVCDHGGSDGSTIHAYTRTDNPEDIHSTAKMGSPLEHTYSGFLTYLDALACEPAEMYHLPRFITEFDKYDGWPQANRGIYGEALKKVASHNLSGHPQPIRSLIAYRWAKHDKWSFKDNGGAQADFREAANRGFRFVAPPHTLNLPFVGNGDNGIPTAPTQPAPTLPRDIDPRATTRGVKIETPPLAPGQEFWHVEQIEWMDETQAGGRHNIYVDVLDANGQRIAGQTMRVEWPGDGETFGTEAKPGEEYAGSTPMGPSRNEYSIKVDDHRPSEVVSGIGMGAETPGGFNAGIHTSTGAVFRLRRKPAASQPQPTQPPVQAGGKVPALNHPVQNPAHRRLTQGWKARPDYYSQFTVDGVPLQGHNGLDFGTPTGSNIVAVDDGRVVERANDVDGYGHYLKIAHTWGESLYAHLSLPMFGVGATVKAGEVIALSGWSGNVDPKGPGGSHLHFGLRVNPYNRQDGMGGYSDPSAYLINSGQSVTPKPPQENATHASILNEIRRAAAEVGLPWELLAAQAWAESSWRQNVPSEAGAMGLMQIMPNTWAEWGPQVGATDPWDARDSARVGAHYMRWLLTKTGGNVHTALIAYGWGIGNILAGKQAPPAIWVQYADKVIYGRDFAQALLADAI